MRVSSLLFAVLCVLWYIHKLSSFAWCSEETTIVEEEEESSILYYVFVCFGGKLLR